jgi:hypothetical protein
MKSIYKFSALFFISTIAYGLITHSFLDNKIGSKILYDPKPKLLEKDELAEKYLEKLFKEEGNSIQKKEDIELGIDFLKSKLKKHEEVIAAQKKIDNNKSTYEIALVKLDGIIKNFEDTKQANVDELKRQKITVKKYEKLLAKNETKKPLNTKKIETVNSSKIKVYEYSNNEKKIDNNKKKIDQRNPYYQSKNQTKDLAAVPISEKQNQSSLEKNKTLNKYYETNSKIEVASYEKNKFKEKVQQIEITRLERNKKLSEEF